VSCKRTGEKMRVKILQQNRMDRKNFLARSLARNNTWTTTFIRKESQLLMKSSPSLGVDNANWFMQQLGRSLKIDSLKHLRRRGSSHRFYLIARQKQIVKKRCKKFWKHFLVDYSRKHKNN
jgi:hypothetical protein